MPEILLHAHSAVEAILYTLVTPCPTCKNGHLDAGEPAFHNAAEQMNVVALCTNCGASHAYCFQVSTPGAGLDPLSNPGPVSEFTEPSRIIDVVQWVTLFAQLIEAAEATPDRQESRWRKHRAAECLDEAMKFYGQGEELPPASACFAAGSQDRLRAHPERFIRQRLLDLRSRLPAIAAAERVQESSPQRPWWRLWG